MPLKLRWPWSESVEAMKKATEQAKVQATVLANASLTLREAVEAIETVVETLQSSQIVLSLETRELGIAKKTIDAAADRLKNALSLVDSVHQIGRGSQSDFVNS